MSRGKGTTMVLWSSMSCTTCISISETSSRCCIFDQLFDYIGFM
uniref:Uncharacterized protein n=1 Tax=Arundo donax TaxID=35708 RepID=A0A0A8Y008_ARUDO